MDLYTFLSRKQIVISEFLLLNYRHIGMTDEMCLLYLQLLRYQQHGNFFPNISELAYIMQKTEQEIYCLLEYLIQEQFIALVTQTDQGKQYDQYDLYPIYEKISEYEQKQSQRHMQEDQQQKQLKKSMQHRMLCRKIEQEFRRPLSPIEMETIQYWLVEGNHSIELIELALREAVLHQAYNLKYMDRILLEWEQKNIQTPEQVQKESVKFQQQKKPKSFSNQPAQDLPQVPLDNWLDDLSK